MAGTCPLAYCHVLKCCCNKSLCFRCSYVIEHWSRWVEVFSVLLFAPVAYESHSGPLSPLAKQAWGHLRRFAMYHLRPSARSTSESRDAARNELLAYARLVDEHIPSLCKQNLHQLVCRLHIQEEQRGHVQLENELWVERVCQLVKSRTRNRAVHDPERLAARYCTDAVTSYRTY